VSEYDQWPEEYTLELNRRIEKALAGDREESEALLQESADYLTSAGRPITDSDGRALQESLHPDLKWYAGAVLHSLANGANAADVIGKRPRGAPKGIKRKPEIMAAILEEIDAGNIRPTKIVDALVDQGVTVKSTAERVLDEIRSDDFILDSQAVLGGMADLLVRVENNNLDAQAAQRVGAALADAARKTDRAFNDLLELTLQQRATGEFSYLITTKDSIEEPYQDPLAAEKALARVRRDDPDAALQQCHRLK